MQILNFMIINILSSIQPGTLLTSKSPRRIHHIPHKPWASFFARPVPQNLNFQDETELLSLAPEETSGTKGVPQARVRTRRLLFPREVTSAPAQ